MYAGRLAVTAVLGLQVGLLAGMVYNATAEQRELGNVPVPLSGPLSSPTIDKLTPNVIELHILSREEFDRQKAAPNIVGWADISVRPCRVYLPAGGPVFLDPQTGRAALIDASSQHDLIHEIMHCERGTWHRNWTDAELGLAPKVER